MCYSIGPVPASSPAFLFFTILTLTLPILRHHLTSIPTIHAPICITLHQSSLTSILNSPVMSYHILTWCYIQKLVTFDSSFRHIVIFHTIIIITCVYLALFRQKCRVDCDPSCIGLRIFVNKCVSNSSRLAWF